MLPSGVVSLLSAVAVASAIPLQRRCNGTDPGDVPPPDPAVTPSLPVNGGETELEGPGSIPLKSIGLGHGIQNYTCESAGAAATPTGALAVVWDVGPLYPGSGPGAISAEEWAGLTSKVLRTTSMPISSSGSGDPFPPDAALDIEGVGTVALLGHHYFDGTGTPTFDLYARQPADAAFVLRAKKDAAVKAPADADRGLTDSGAVDWLRLSDKGGSEGDVSLVFRVLTAGGSPAACESEDQTESVPYTAMYWFY